MPDTERYRDYRAAIAPYECFMRLLGTVFRTCGICVSLHDNVLVIARGWMHDDARIQYQGAAQIIAAMRHVATLPEGD